MIQAQNIHKSFGSVRAVRGISFSVSRGEIVGLLGPNGAGKTTTIRMATGFLPPDAGRIRIDGLDSLDQSLQARQRIGYLPESTPIYPEMTVVGMLRHRARLQSMPRRSRQAAVDHAIERCWLTEMRTRRVGELSKGYRQRVGLAGAIVHDPAALFLDEPTNGLDPAQITKMRSLMAELAQDRALVVSSHILSEVEKTCQRIIVIANGRIRADAPLDQLAQLADADADQGRCVVEARLSDAARAGATLAKLFASIPQVAHVNDQTKDESTGWRRLTLTPAPQNAEGLCEIVGENLASLGVVVRELHQESSTLESVFLDLISREEQPEETP